MVLGMKGKMMNTYAQDKEDLILWQILSDVKKGFYIDVGANSPDVYSVTKLFYENGWNGINIEPLPDMYVELCVKRERDVNLNMGMGNKHGRMTLHIEGMLSTFSDQVVIDQHLGDKPTLQVEVMTLASVLKSYNPEEIHFCKIDVEGFERQVLEGMDWNYRPWVFCMESTKPNTDIPCHEEWENILLWHGYVCEYTHGINRYYIDATNHKELLGKDIKL